MLPGLKLEILEQAQRAQPSRKSVGNDGMADGAEPNQTGWVASCFVHKFSSATTGLRIAVLIHSVFDEKIY